MIDLMPTLAVWIGIGSAILVPWLFFLSRYCGYDRLSIISRLILTAALAHCFFAASIVVAFSITTPRATWVDLISGLLVLWIALLGNYVFVSVLAWSFRLETLLSLERAGGPLTSVEWAARFGDGRGLQALLTGRLHTLLAGSLVVEMPQGLLLLSPGRGSRLARAVKVARHLLNLDRQEVA